jgi:hypothetical protein
MRTRELPFILLFTYFTSNKKSYSQIREVINLTRERESGLYIGRIRSIIQIIYNLYIGIVK